MSLRQLTSQSVLNYAENILNIEREAFESSLLSLFNKRNHADFVRRLSEKKDGLQYIAKLIVEKKSSKQNENELDLQPFILSLIRLADAIIVVCSGLDLKSKGFPFSHQQYKSGITLIEVEKVMCTRASELCNLRERWLMLVSKK